MLQSRSSCAASTRTGCVRQTFCGTLSARPHGSKGTVRQSSVAMRARPVDESNFDNEVLETKGPVLAEFWATWCGPCRLVAPLMTWAEKEYGEALKVVKINHTGNPKLIEKYKVYGLPTIMLFQDGQQVPNSKREGAITKQLLTAYLDKYGIKSGQAAK